MEAKQLYKEKNVDSEGLNARQVFNKVRDQITFKKLQMPSRCQEQAPKEINVYSDGSYLNGRRRTWAMGAAGVWWPGRQSDPEHDAVSEGDIAYGEQCRGGLKLFTNLAGYGCSSTRAELAAGIVAIAANGPVHLGTDSKAFLDKAPYVLDLCRSGAEPKRPWNVQTDGDL